MSDRSGLSTKKYKVGIVVPSYNQGNYLEKALESIVQNMQHISIDLVVMDGGSKDNSIDIIKKYERYISYWQSQADGGQAAAINSGMKHLGDCEYVMWLNSDDEYENEWSVCRIAEWAEKTGADVCYGKSYLIDRESKRIGEYDTKEFSLKGLNNECYISQPSVMIRKDIWEREGGLDERLMMCLDYEFWIRLAKKYRFSYCGMFIGNTRIYEDTKTSTMQGRHLCEAISILQKQFGYVPMRWISTEWIWENGIKVRNRVHLYVLSAFLLLRKKKIIREMGDRCGYR